MEVYENTMEEQTRMRLTRTLLDNQTLEQAALDTQNRCEQLEREAAEAASLIEELQAKVRGRVGREVRVVAKGYETAKNLTTNRCLTRLPPPPTPRQLKHTQLDAASLTDKNRALAEEKRKVEHELVASEQLAIAAVDKNGTWVL